MLLAQLLHQSGYAALILRWQKGAAVKTLLIAAHQMREVCLQEWHEDLERARLEEYRVGRDELGIGLRRCLDGPLQLDQRVIDARQHRRAVHTRMDAGGHQ